MPKQRQVSTKSARSASKGRLRTSKETVIFAKDTVIAVPGQDHRLNFRLAKLTQDVLESTKKITVKFLRRYKEESIQKIFISEEVTDALPVDDIIGEADVSTYSKTLKKKQPKKTCYELRPSSFLQLKKLAQTRKGEAAQTDEDDEEDDEEDEEENAEEGDDDDDEEEEEEQEAEDDKERRSREKKKPTVYKKGKWNPVVEVIEVDEILEGKDNQPVDYGSYNQDNRNLIRAVYTGNHKLLENCFAKNNFFSNLYARWSVDSNYNAIELAFMKNDKKAIQLFCAAYADPQKSPTLAHQPPTAFNAFNTDENSKDAYGVATRRVEMGRGGRELANAYIKDQDLNEQFDEQTIKKIVEVCDDTSLLDILRVDVQPDPSQSYHYNPLSNIEAMLDQSLEHAVLAGNIKVAAYLAKQMQKNGGFGLTPMHAEVLIKNDHERIVHGNLKRPSYVAKIYGSNITPIHFACINPNGKVLETVLAKAPEYSITDFKMRRPIHYAAACQGPEPLKVLLKHNVDFREGDREKVTALMVAAKLGRVENVEALLATGEKSIITQKNKEGNTAIHLAAQRGHLNILKLFQKHEAKIDAPGKDRSTPLAQAAANGHFDCVQWLVENGAKTTKKDKFKKSALIAAVMNGHVRITTFLLQHGAEFAGPDSSKITPIHYAAAYGFPELIDVLIKAGASQNVGDSQKLTPLAVAMLKNNNAVMKKLLSYPDTDVNCRDNQGRSLIMVAASTPTKQNVEHIKFLLVDNAADSNLKDLKGNTALNLVCSLNINSMINGSPRLYNVCDQTERAKLVEEIKQEFYQLQSEIIKLLLDNKASINEPNQAGLTPFYSALEQSNFFVCDLLLEHANLDVTVVSRSDEGIYHILAKIITEEKGLALFNRVLKAVGAKNNLINLADEEGFTPFLRIVLAFRDKTAGIFQTYTNTIQQGKLAEKQRAWDERQRAKKEEEQDKANAAASAATTAASSNLRAKKAPRKTAMMATPATSLFARPTFQAFGNDPNDRRPVSLTTEELEAVIEEAEDKFNVFIETIITACKDLITAGANPADTVQKLKRYRGDKGRASPKTPEATQLHLLDQIDGQGGRRHNRNYSHNHMDYDAKLRSEYGQAGQQNALHLVQSFPHPRFLKFLLGFSSLGLDINHQDHLDRTPLHYFVAQNSTNIKVSLVDVLKLFIDAKANLNLTDGAKNTPLFLSITQNHFHFTVPLIKAGANINIVNKNGDSPLLYCVKNNKLSQADELLKAGADPNLPDAMHRSALHHSLNNSKLAHDPSFEMEATLLRFGANINALDDRGRTPLHYAFITIDNPFDYFVIDPVEVVTSLCCHKACDVHVKDRWGSTALHYAAQRGAQICALTLLKRGAKVDAVDNDGNTPLAVALHAKHPEMAIMLIQCNSDVNGLIHIKEKKPEEPVFDEDEGSENYDDEDEDQQEEDEDQEEEEEDESVPQHHRFGHQHQQYGGGRSNLLDLSVGDYSMFTVAIKRDYQSVAYLMLLHGYDLARAIHDSINEKKMNYVWTLLTRVRDRSVLQRRTESGQNIFHSFAQRGSNATPALTKKIFTALLNNKVDFTLKDNIGRTPLHYAAVANFRNLMEQLITAGADINAQDNDGFTPFTLQMISHPKSIASFIDLYIIHKANFQLKFKVKSHDEEVEIGALTYLISKGDRNIDLLRLLINNGLSVNETDENGTSSLMHAIKQNSTRLVKFILSFPDLDKTTRTKDRKTPIHFVVNPLDYGSFENTDILEMLAPYFDINAVDAKGKAPIHYAYLQDSGVMVEKLKELGAVDNVGSIDWADEEVPYEEDAEKYVAEKSKEKTDKIDEGEEKVLTPLDLESNKVPKSEITDEAILEIMKDITSVDMYHRVVEDYGVDTDVLPLARLDKSFLLEAQDVLVELREVIRDIELEEEKNNMDDRDVKRILELQEQALEKTIKFYELIPNNDFRDQAIERIRDKVEVSSKLRMVSDLLDIEISSKIILGALSKNYQVNPLDYCFNALSIKMVKLDLENPEAVVIQRYIQGSNGPVGEGFIKNVFALERKGEAERISQWKHLKNRTLLWHGSKIANFMGIFAQGLRIAPSEAGGSRGRGLIFADMFTVSSGHCDHTGGYKLLLLCEVALGDIFETKQTEADVGEIQAPFKSVKVLGRQGPREDKRIVMPNGCIVPVGKVVDYYENAKREELPVLGESEYIVYDLSHVRIKYLVQTQ